MEKSCVHIYTGDGKGKTTAATGLAARAAGQRLRVGFFQFMKSGVSGELLSLTRLGVTVVSPQGSGKFIWDMDEDEKAAYAKQQQDTFERAAEMAPQLDLLILDELVCCVDTGMIPLERVQAFLQQRPQNLEVVMTGRGAGPELAELADYFTEMRMVKHPYNDGLAVRKGIEF